MPFIYVKSLPFDPPLEMSAIVEGLTEDFAKGTGIGLEHVTATWEFLTAGHYAVAGKAASHQPQATHPVLVEILSPDFNQGAQIERMLRTVAESVSKRANVSINNIFINHRHAHSGMVFDAGNVVKW